MTIQQLSSKTYQELFYILVVYKQEKLISINHLDFLTSLLVLRPREINLNIVCNYIYILSLITGYEANQYKNFMNKYKI